MKAANLHNALLVILLSGTLAHGRDTPLDADGQLDAYDTLRRNCSLAGEEDWKRCQRTEVRQTDASRHFCSEARERERRMCMLQVMERQNRDIQSPIEPSAQ